MAEISQADARRLGVAAKATLEAWRIVIEVLDSTVPAHAEAMVRSTEMVEGALRDMAAMPEFAL